MDDTALLNQYVHAGCERAFAELVHRHIDLVYGSARRLTGDPHVAEDVTQAVFIVLAKKAARVRHGAVLPAWLLTTTRYASANAMTKSSRRRKHERAAAMNSPMNSTMNSSMSSDDAIGPGLDDSISGEDGQMSAALDAALARLGTTDRSVVAMRYLQGRSISDIAVALGVSQDAAQKRVLRALARLRDYFARRGVVLDGMDLDAGLSRQLRQVAPAALAPAVVTKAILAKTLAGGTGAAGAIADVVLRSISLMTTAKIAATCAIAIVVLGATAAAVQSAGNKPSANPAPTGAAPATGAPVVVAATLPAPKPFVPLRLSAEAVWQPYVPSTQPGTEVIALKNDSLLPGRKDKTTLMGYDPDTRRAPGADPAVEVRDDSGSGGNMTRRFDAAPYHGKRIRLSGFVKSKDVERISGLFVVVYRADGAWLAQDDLGGRQVHGTTDWARHDIVCDVSPQAAGITVHVFLRGQGTVWADGLELAVVDESVPNNDDHRWRGWTFTPGKFQTALDRKVLHDGHPTICMTGKDTNHPVNDWISYDHTELDVRPFLGHKVRLSVMIKSDGVSYAGPVIRGVGVNNTTAARDEFNGRRPVRGTTDWRKYATTIVMPKNAIDMSFGVWMNGKGKVWFDDLRLEIME
jgi:RNA polymerase sigma factor (sigma-70 family)